MDNPQAWLEARREDAQNDLLALCRIESVKGPAESEAPFGSEVRRALDFVLELAERLGLDVLCDEGYAGHAQVGEKGSPFVILTHLDVVPATPDAWTSPPFEPEIRDGRIYARGVLDNKCAAIAALYATAALKACGAPIVRPIRVVFGCDEESGCADIAHYRASVGLPDEGFAPDASFPVIHAEKGIAWFTLHTGGGADTLLASFHAGQRPNMVPDAASAAFVAPPDADFRQRAEDAGLVWQGDTLLAHGVPAHGSTPHEGKNAAQRLAVFLLENGVGQPVAAEAVCKDGPGDAANPNDAPSNPPEETPEYLDDDDLPMDFDIDGLPDDENIPSPLSAAGALLRWVARADCQGKTLGLDGSDTPSGALTLNVGTVEIAGDCAQSTWDMRYPVTWKWPELWQRIQETLAPGTVELVQHQPALHVPKDDPLVRTLTEVYTQSTGLREAPISTGGGTYARALTRGVAFGPVAASESHSVHQADENLSVQDFEHLTDIMLAAVLKISSQKKLTPKKPQSFDQRLAARRPPRDVRSQAADKRPYDAHSQDADNPPRTAPPQAAYAEGGSQKNEPSTPPVPPRGFAYGKRSRWVYFLCCFVAMLAGGLGLIHLARAPLAPPTAGTVITARPVVWSGQEALPDREFSFLGKPLVLRHATTTGQMVYTRAPGGALPFADGYERRQAFYDDEDNIYIFAANGTLTAYTPALFRFEPIEDREAAQERAWRTLVDIWGDEGGYSFTKADNANTRFEFTKILQEGVLTDDVCIVQLYADGKFAMEAPYHGRYDDRRLRHSVEPNNCLDRLTNFKPKEILECQMVPQEGYMTVCDGKVTYGMVYRGSDPDDLWWYAFVLE